MAYKAEYKLIIAAGYHEIVIGLRLTSQPLQLMTIEKRITPRGDLLRRKSPSIHW